MPREPKSNQCPLCPEIEGKSKSLSTKTLLDLHIRQNHKLFYIGQKSKKVVAILQWRSPTSLLQCFWTSCGKQYSRYDKLGDHLRNQHKMSGVEWTSCDELLDKYAGLPHNCVLLDELLIEPPSLPPVDVSRTTSPVPGNRSRRLHHQKSSLAPPDATMQEETSPRSPFLQAAMTVSEDLQPLRSVYPLQDYNEAGASSFEISQLLEKGQEHAHSSNEEPPASLPAHQVIDKENIEKEPDTKGIKRSAFQASLASGGETTTRRSKRPRKQATVGYIAPSAGPKSSADPVLKSVLENDEKDYLLSVPDPKWRHSWEEADKILSLAGYFLIKDFENEGCLAIACMICRKAQSVDRRGYETHASSKHKTPIPRENLAAIETWIKQMSAEFDFANNASQLLDDWKNKHPRKPLHNLYVADGFVCTACGKGYGTKDSAMKHFRVTHAGLNQIEGYEKLRPAVIQSVFDRREFYEVTIEQQTSTESRRNSISALCRPMCSSAQEEAGGQDDSRGPTVVKLCPLLERTRWDKHLAKLNLSTSQKRNLLSLTAPGRSSEEGNIYGKPLLAIIRRYQLAVLSTANATQPGIRIHLSKEPRSKSKKKKPWRPSLNPLCYARILQRLVAIVCRLVREGGKKPGFDLGLSKESREAAEALSLALEQHSEIIDQDEDGDRIEDILEETDEDVIDDEGDDFEQLEDEFEDREGGDDESDNSDWDGSDDESRQFGSVVDKDKDKHNRSKADQAGSRASSSETEGGSSANGDGTAGCIDKLHHFLVELLLLPVVERTHSHPTPHEAPPWDLPIERLLAAYSLEEGSTGDFGFKAAEKLTKLFAALHYFIRGAILYRAASASQHRNSEDCERAVKQATRLNFDHASQSPYTICRTYQKIASTVSYDAPRPAATSVSPDGMSFRYCKDVLLMPTFRHAIERLLQTATTSLQTLCKGETVKMPQFIPDDWTNEDRGYSWTRQDPENFGQKGSVPILVKKALECIEKPIAVCKTDDSGAEVLEFDEERMVEILEECARINVMLFLLVFFTSGQPPRGSEIAHYKFANSTRARNMTAHDGSFWLLKRRTKTESADRMERVIVSQLCPAVSALFLIYLILVRPLERHLAFHLYHRDRPDLGSCLSEYLWVQNGKKVTPSEARIMVNTFLEEECNFNGGIRGYRQLCTQMIRIYIGSELEARAEDLNELQNPTDESFRKLHWVDLPEGLINLPGLSSTLVRRYGRASQDWWEILGLKPGCEPMKPYEARNRRASSLSQEGRASLAVDKVYRYFTKAPDAGH